MKKNVLHIISFFFLLVTIAEASDTLSIPTLYPSETTAYDIDQGLSVSCIRSVIADSTGLLWINPCVSMEIYRSLGFFQYDGDRSSAISMEPDSAAQQVIWDLRGITPGQLLFGHSQDRTHYLFLLDPETREHQVFPLDGNERVTNMLAGENREAYVLTESPNAYALYRIALEEKTLLTRIAITPEKKRYFATDTPAARSGNVIWFLHRDQGFIRYSIADNRVQQYDWRTLKGDALPAYPTFDTEGYDVALAVDHRGDLLCYIHALRELFIFETSSETLFRRRQVGAFLKPIRLPEEVYLYFDQDQVGNILLNFSWTPANPEDAFFVTLLLDPAGRLFDYTPISTMANTGRYGRTSSDDFFSRNFKKNVLMATSGGLIAVDVQADLSITYRFKEWAMRGMAVLDDDHLLVISESGQRGVINLQTMEAAEMTKGSADAPFFEIRALAQLVEKENCLWLPMEEGRLGCYQKKDRSFRYYPVGQTFDKFQLLNDREVILVNTQNEVYRYDLDAAKLSPLGTGGVPLHINGSPNEVYLSRDGILWIASLNGLWRIDPRTGAVRRLGKEDGFEDERIMCINEAEDGKLWLGTFGAGLHIYDPQTGALEVIDQSGGLSNNTVVGILTDAQGDRWISTFDGITVVSPKGKVLFELSEKEGISHREFNRYSYYKTGDGQLIFGGVAGVNVLDPLKIKRAFLQEEELQIYLTAVSYYDRGRKADIRLTTGFDQLNRLNIPAAHRYIDLDFGLSDYLTPEKNVFSYRIDRSGSGYIEPEGPEIWTTIGPDSRLILNDLPSGDYTILVRGINSKGQWTEKPVAVPVRVNEFFYKTWWFYVLCSLPFFLGAYFWIRRLMTERARLETEVEMRTRQIRKDKELIEDQAAKLQEMDELKSRFFTNISHEFRTPLTVISGMATQVKTDPEKWLEKGMELIQRNSGQLLTLINQILDLRKLESGALKTRLIRGDIIANLNYIADAFVGMAQSKGLRIHVLSALPRLEMDYDPDKMMHILSNLLSNAIKYTPAPGDIYLQIDRRTEAGRELLAIQVKDTGPGIPAEDLPHIFDRFYQADPDHYRGGEHKPQGTGVGLTLTRELVVLLGGTIRADSVPGAGSTFTVSLPVTRNAPLQTTPMAATSPESTLMIPFAAVPEVTAPGAAQPPVAEASTGSTERSTLLIVEDNPDVRLYLQACLEPHYELLTAENGQEGIDRAVEWTPDLIVSDVMMPVRDGFALCDTLKNDERTSHIPIILLTARADFESRIKGLRKGADVYLAKPFEREELLAHLEQTLDLRKKLQERYRKLYLAEGQPMASGVPKLESEAVELEDAFIQKTRQLILDHIAEEDFGIVHLCRSLAVSRTQLHNKITALTGLSTTALIRSIRLHKAHELLLSTDLNVSEVGYEVGFGNPAYFSRIYAEEFGETPRETRK
jgi:signal transduction histidine kinase/DNA-binding response OmpR family regulator